MIPIKSPPEIEIMKEGGKISARILAETLAAARPDVSTLELDRLAEKMILESGGQPSFKGFQDYPFATCINVNEGIVHGIPKADVILKKGDILTVDLGALYKGFHTDNAKTVEVGKEPGSFSSEPGSETDKFLERGQRALENAIKQCQIGNHVGDISHAIQTTVEDAGYSVTRELGGHGVGKELHEPPFIPEFGQPEEGPLIKEGMALAIEVIFAKGDATIGLLDDGWTIVTADDSLAALFEHTVAATADGPIILTRG